MPALIASLLLASASAIVDPHDRCEELARKITRAAAVVYVADEPAHYLHTVREAARKLEATDCSRSSVDLESVRRLVRFADAELRSCSADWLRIGRGLGNRRDDLDVVNAYWTAATIDDTNEEAIGQLYLLMFPISMASIPAPNRFRLPWQAGTYGHVIRRSSYLDEYVWGEWLDIDPHVKFDRFCGRPQPLPRADDEQR